MIDWSAGEYERTAAELEPVAQRVVELAAPQSGEDVLDLGCGTGNAALLAAAAGARAVGVDSAKRLVEVARRRAADSRLAASFVVGELEALPFEPASFDCVLSVFGVIFAADPGRALSELVRVLRPGGRAYLTAWLPEGPIFEMVGVFMRALAEVEGPPPASRFPWHQAGALAELAEGHGALLSSHQAQLEISAPSAEAYLAENQQFHPASLPTRRALERAGVYQAAREQALAVLERANRSQRRFSVLTPYRIHVLEIPVAAQ